MFLVLICSGRIGPMFTILSLRAGEWSASCSGCFTSGEIYHGVHRIEGWVGRCVEETKFQEPVVRLYTDWAILTPLLSSGHWFELIVNISADRGNVFICFLKSVIQQPQHTEDNTADESLHLYLPSENNATSLPSLQKSDAYFVQLTASSLILFKS
jgi:hypothetical protein